jgi:hypothetical protein
MPRLPRHPRPAPGDRVESVGPVSNLGVVSGVVVCLIHINDIEYIRLTDIKCGLDQPSWWSREQDFTYTPYAWRPA